METTEKGLALLNKQKPTLAQLILVSSPKGTTIEEATMIAIKEISNYEMILSMRPELKACNALSVVHAVKQAINDGLTLNQSAGLVYLLPTKVKVGQNGNQDVYDWALRYDPTANGRLSIAYQSGAILDHKRPVPTFDADGKLDTITFEMLVPSFGQPRWEAVTFNKMHFQKWMAASAKKNKGSANANYTSWNGGIDPEFAATKAIRHGLDKRGSNLNSKRVAISEELQGRIKLETPIDVVIKEAAEENMSESTIVHSQVTKHVHDEDANIISETLTIKPNNELPV